MRVMCYAAGRCATRIGLTSSSTKLPLTRSATTGGLACAQAVEIRGAPHVARRHAVVPRALQLRVATVRHREMGTR